MLIALITGYSDSPPCILTIFKPVSPVQFSTISQNADQVVLAPDQSRLEETRPPFNHLTKVIHSLL